MVMEMFTSPQVLQNVANGFFQFLGNLLYAIIVVLIGWVVGSILSSLLDKVLDKIKFEKFLKDHKVEDALGTTKIDKLFVQFVKYYIIVLFLADAMKIIQLGTLGNLMASLVNFAPVAIGGALVVVMAAVFGEFAKEKILEVSSKSSLAKISAKVTKFLIIYVGAVIALGTMGFDVAILDHAFTTLIQGVAYGIALAFGIAFGLGGQDDAKDFVKKTRKQLNV